jgi:ribosomal protein S18 acetylase RimI-like enzyme
VEPEYLWLVKLYLLSDYRGKGLGSALLTHVMQQARVQGKRVRLRVLRVNTGAMRLYERHGFEVVQETPERFLMESHRSL